MKILSALLLLGVTSALVGYLFYPEAGGVIWHLRHGATADFCELHLSVPLLYSVNSDPQKRVIYLVAVPGRWRNYFKGERPSKVSLIALHQFSDQRTGQLPTSKKDTWAAKDFSEMMNKPFNLAGNNGRCVGFDGPPMWNGDKDVEIFCEFEHGYEAHFSGTNLGVNDFFVILKTAEPARGKH